MLSHKMQEMTGGRRQLDGGTPCNLYALLNIMRVIWAGQTAHLAKTIVAYSIVVVRPKGLRRRLEVRVNKMIVTFRGPCIVIYSYNKTKEIH